MTVLDVKGEPHERSFDQPAHPRRPRLGLGAPNLPQGFTDTFTSRYVDTGELCLYAVIGGDGPPLLLVHGWPQTWYAWRMLMPTLARDFQVIAVDQRGIGLSDKPQDGYDTGTLTGDMVAPMDALGHQRFAVYGTDTGMPIAYAVAADHRDRLDRLVVSEAPSRACPPRRLGRDQQAPRRRRQLLHRPPRLRPRCPARRLRALPRVPHHHRPEPAAQDPAAEPARPGHRRRGKLR